MRQILAILILTCSLGGQAHAQNKENLRNGSEISVLFVGGFLNEGLFGYFSYNKQTLMNNFGVDRIHEVYPHSNIGIEAGAKLVSEKINQVFNEEKKPIILIGHSKGGAEALCAVLSQTELIRNEVIAEVIIIQGAIGGSPLADQGLNLVTTTPLKSAVELGQGIMKKYYNQSLIEGALNLNPGFIKPLFQKLKANLSSDDLKIINPRIHYVRSTQENSKLSGSVYLAGVLLNKFYGISDGMVLLKDQLLEGIGTDLVSPLNADHADLVAWGAHITNSTAESQIDFSISVFGKFLKRIK